MPFIEVPKLTGKANKHKNIEYLENSNNCWICISHSRNNRGYARITINKKFLYIHRYIYKRFKGEIPKGMNICHTCDNPACINPDHLFLGTQKDNLNDMFNKGRGYKFPIYKGENTGGAKLTEAQAKEIKYKYKNIPNKELEKIYPVNNDTINLIKKGILWKHI